MIYLALSIVCVSVYFYWLGGQSKDNIPFADTYWRDIGCTICIFTLECLLFGFHWAMLGTLICWAGFAIGDKESLFWSLHGFVVSLGMLPYAVFSHQYLVFALMSVVVTGGTYLVSRFLNKNGADVILRGVFYSTMPFWFLIK